MVCFENFDKSIQGQNVAVIEKRLILSEVFIEKIEEWGNELNSIKLKFYRYN